MIEAASGEQAGAALIERGWYPLSVEPAEPGAGLRRPAGRRDLAIVFRSLASLVSAGVPVARAVAASVPVARGSLRDLLVVTGDELRAGRTLAQALGSGQGIVPPLVLGMLRAGERASRLGSALEQVAAQLEQEAELTGRIRQALAYPILLGVAGMLSILVIGIVVVPKFAVMLADLGQELPPATRTLLVISALLSGHWMIRLVTAVACAGMFTTWIRRPEGRLRWHSALLALPGIGAIRLALASARVGRALGGSLRAGMPLLPALEAAREAAGDRAVAHRLAQVRERVSQGQSLAAVMESMGALSPTALQLVAVGEASGALAHMADRAGDLAAQEAERGIKTVVSLLEPALVVVFGGLVAFIAAALLQAVYSLRPGGV